MQQFCQGRKVGQVGKEWEMECQVARIVSPFPSEGKSLFQKRSQILVEPDLLEIWNGILLLSITQVWYCCQGYLHQLTTQKGAGYDGHKRRKGSKMHTAVDTLGQLLAMLVTPANEQDRAQVGELVQQIQKATGDSVEVAFVDQGYTGDKPAAAVEEYGIRLEVVKLPTAKRGFVLLPHRWVVERSFGWMARFRRLLRDYERLAETLVRLHFVAFAMLLAHRFVTFMVQGA
jgi:transposase